MGRNLQAGINQISGIGLNVFSDDELFVIHCATLEVLQCVTPKKAGQLVGCGTSGGPVPVNNAKYLTGSWRNTLLRFLPSIMAQDFRT